MPAPVLVTRADDARILVVTLNRPEARNAVNGEVARGVAEALDLLDADDDLRVGVLTGVGKGFSAGMDLKGFVSGDDPTEGGRGFGGIVESPPRKPLVAAIEGFALAGGLEIVLACDLIVAARDALLGLPEVKRSLVAAGGGLLRLATRIPYSVAAELALGGEPVAAARLHEVGLVNRLTEPGDALATALTIASGIAANAPLALAASKEILASAGDWGLSDGWSRQVEIATAVAGSADAREGAMAFAERRDPVWRGR